MKNHLHLSLALTLLCFLFSACEKTESIVYRGGGSFDTKLSYLDDVFHLTIFQYAEIDASGENVRGWVINRGGEIRSFETEITNWDPASMKLDLDQLVTPAHLSSMNGDLLDRIPMAELAKYYKKIEKTFTDDVEINVENPHDQSSVAFIGYVTDETDHTEDCPGDGSTANYGRQVVISIDGGVNLKNETEAAKELLEWLDIVNEEIYD